MKKLISVLSTFLLIVAVPLLVAPALSYADKNDVGLLDRDLATESTQESARSGYYFGSKMTMTETIRANKQLKKALREDTSRSDIFENSDEDNKRLREIANRNKRGDRVNDAKLTRKVGKRDPFAKPLSQKQMAAIDSAAAKKEAKEEKKRKKRLQRERAAAMGQ